MSAVQLSDFQFSFDTGPGDQVPLKVFQEPQPQAVEVVKPEVVECRSLADLYSELLAEIDKEKRVSIKTIRDNRSALVKFEAWGRTQHRIVAGRPLSLLEQPKILRTYAEFLRAKPKGNSSAMASKACSAIGKLARACVRAGMLKQKPETVSKSTINLLRPRTEEQRRVKAVPVTLAELQAMLAVVDGCRWPRLGKVEPSVFWQTSLLLITFTVFGHRIGSRHDQPRSEDCFGRV
jgi:hypothetical protein